MMNVLRQNKFGLAILACAAVSFAFPSAFVSWGGVKLTKLVSPAIQVIMFGMGTTLTLADFVRVAKCPWAVGIGILLQFLVMPLVGFALALAFGFSGELAAGCVLVGSVAGGTASNVIAYLAGANVALSVTMTCCSTLLSPFLTPLLMKGFAGQFVAIDVKAMMLSMLMIVIVPVAAGGLVRWIFAKRLEAHKATVDKVLSFVSMAGICFTILALTAPSRETFKSAGACIVLAAILHNSIGFASGYWLTRLLGRVLPLSKQDARTVAIEVGMQNGGMAGALATDVLHSAVAALPANVFSIWMNFSGSVLAGFWRPGRTAVRTLLVLFALTAGAARADSFLNPGDRWILSGDSITSTDTYRQILQLAIDHYHPGSGVVIGNRGVWGQKLSEEKKLSAKEKPQIVSIMIAMNSFIHHEYGTRTDFSKTISAHVEGLRTKIREYQAMGATVILMTPTLTDEREGGFFVTYNSRPGLAACGAAIRTLAREEGCLLVPVAEAVEAYKEEMGPYETFIPDGVHPYGYGQYAIARAFLRRMDFAGALGGGRRLREPSSVAPLQLRLKTRFLNAPDAPIVFATEGVKGKVRWSVWCDSLRVMADDDCAGHCMVRGTYELDGSAEWRLPAPPEALALQVGERARVLVDITPDDGESRLFVVDLAKNRVIHLKDGRASGTIVTDQPRREGATVCTWEVREEGPDLWFTGRTTADEFGYKPYGAWANVFNMNGLQALFDFRPFDRFAGVNPDRDAPMVLLSVLDDPAFTIMPLVWMGRRYQAALFTYAAKCEGGYTWTLGFRGNVTDCEAFDVRKLDCYGLHLMVADYENGKCVRYTDAPYLPNDNPERRMNQMTVFDRRGKFPSDETVSISLFAF